MQSFNRIDKVVENVDVQKKVIVDNELQKKNSWKSAVVVVEVVEK